ncbi:hypothetical protein SAMN05421670_3017 [Psychrobacillus psychrotolerans]|uniref:Uncharacterized protein n=1 Tax=Psychrobacillus psychrotolerans TaxID=126156 RepID=A0A1I6A032_9BACI|nr:hypothetical protein [Psychrobacillus psychrotolerans]SFQ62035.1 hypothetical protein SAMN05421670_3017 [Psychrobacillus psychrotolerans]
MNKKKSDEQMNTIMAAKKATRKEKIQSSIKKAVHANGKALEKLSKN